MRREPDSQPNEKDFVIIHNLQAFRETKYPGRGGKQACAEAMGVSRWQYYNWENGSRTPRDKNLKKVAEFYGVPLEALKAKPENWSEVYPKLLAKWRKRVGAPEPEEEEIKEASKPAPPPTGEAGNSMDQMNAIIKHLIKMQVMVEEGQLDSQFFSKALAELHDYTLFKLPK